VQLGRPQHCQFPFHVPRPFAPTFTAAAGYKYDLVKLANPSVNVPVGTNSGGDLATDGYTFVEEKSDVPTAGLGAASSTFEHALAVADASALYAVRVWSYNDNDQTGKASGWSAAIGTGEPSQLCRAE